YANPGRRGVCRYLPAGVQRRYRSSRRALSSNHKKLGYSRTVPTRTGQSTITFPDSSRRAPAQSDRLFASPLAVCENQDRAWKDQADIQDCIDFEVRSEYVHKRPGATIPPRRRRNFLPSRGRSFVKNPYQFPALTRAGEPLYPEKTM